MRFRTWLVLASLFLVSGAWGAVSTEIVRSDFVGNGSLAAYTTTFQAKATTEVRVFKKATDADEVELTAGVDYTAVLTTGGTVTVTLTAGNLPNGYKLSLQRGIPYTQTINPATGGAYNPTTLANGLDRLSHQVQRLKAEVDRSIKIPFTEVGGDSVTKLDTLAADRANQALVFDASGNAMVGGTLTGVSASAWAQTLLDDASADAARTTLGLPSQAMAARTVVANDTSGSANGTARSIDDLTVLADGSTARRDLSARFADIINVLDHGAVADGTTDNTAAITTAAGIAGARVLLIPPGVKFNRTTLIAALPATVVCLDFSMINDYTSGGETCKHIGILSKDSEPNDTHWSIDSAHHAIMALNNFGSAGTASASERKATQIWNSGFYALGTDAQKGFRGNAMQQWTKSGSGNYWVWKIASIAPWVAIAANYELWAQGQTIGGAGVYRANGGGMYVSTGAGTTGSTAPVHTSGTVSDGGVSWTYVDSTDRTVWQIDEYGRVGNGSSTETFFHRVGISDPNGDYAMHLQARGISKHVRQQASPTDGSGNLVAQPYYRWDTTGMRIMKSDSSSDMASWTDAGMNVKVFRMTHATAADADTTPSVLNLSTLYLSNTGATNVTTLDDSVDNQVVRLIATNGNTTLVHGGSFNLTGSINVTLTAYSSVTMQKVPSAISNRWVEVARSIK